MKKNFALFHSVSGSSCWTSSTSAEHLPSMQPQNGACHIPLCWLWTTWAIFTPCVCTKRKEVKQKTFPLSLPYSEARRNTFLFSSRLLLPCHAAISRCLTLYKYRSPRASLSLSLLRSNIFFLFWSRIQFSCRNQSLAEISATFLTGEIAFSMPRCDWRLHCLDNNSSELGRDEPQRCLE